jgi:hypothetical protein
MKILDFPIAPRRDLGPCPRGEAGVHLRGFGAVIAFPVREIRNHREIVVLYDRDGWHDWPSDADAADGLTF